MCRVQKYLAVAAQEAQQSDVNYRHGAVVVNGRLVPARAIDGPSCEFCSNIVGGGHNVLQCPLAIAVRSKVCLECEAELEKCNCRRFWLLLAASLSLN